MRRRPGTLLPVEVAILEAGLELHRGEDQEFHGYGIAKRIKDREGARQMLAHGTLYKALGRLEEGGLLASHWEDPTRAVEEGRPPRRLYVVTGAGERAYHLARSQIRQTVTRPAAGLEPT